MPEISRFFGIVIRMFYNEHNPPHIHAQYGDAEAIFDLNGAKVIKGRLSDKEKFLVKLWLSEHKSELLKMWNTKKIVKIKGLK